MNLPVRLFMILRSVSILTNTASAQPSVIAHLNVSTVAATVPGNGDVNPYGVAIVPVSTGALNAGSILVSNFNNSTNAQGTGTARQDPVQRTHGEAFAEVSIYHPAHARAESD